MLHVEETKKTEWKKFYSGFILGDAEFDIKKLYERYQDLCAKEIIRKQKLSANAADELDKNHARWLLLRSTFEDLKKFHDTHLAAPEHIISDEEDLPANSILALHIFNGIETLMDQDIKIIENMKAATDEEKSKIENALNHLKSQIKSFSALDSDKNKIRKKINVIIGYAQKLYGDNAPRPKKTITHDSHQISSPAIHQHKKPAGTAGIISIIEKYHHAQSYFNFYGKKRAEELLEKVKSAKNNSEMTKVIADFMITGKTQIDSRRLSFFRSFGRCSNLFRDSLRGMMLDNIIPDAISASKDDWLRATQIDSFLKEPYQHILDITKRNLQLRFGIDNESVKQDELVVTDELALTSMQVPTISPRLRTLS